MADLRTNGCNTDRRHQVRKDTVIFFMGYYHLM